MRLLEPINGIKAVQGHWLIHIIFLVVMMTIKDNVEKNLIHSGDVNVNAPTGHTPAKDAHTLILEIQNDLLELSHSDDGKTDKEKKLDAKEHELFIFQVLMAGHFVSLVSILFVFHLKRNHNYILGQAIQGFGIICQFILVWYMVYTVKLGFDSWNEDINMIRIWLYIEVVYLFNYIVASCIFTMFAQLFKFKSSVKSDESLHNDDNVWNDKESDDFLRYIKFDFFTFTYIICSLLMNIMFGFSHGQEVSRFDPLQTDQTTWFNRRGSQVGQISAMLIFIRCSHVIFNVIQLSYGTKFLELRKTKLAKLLQTLSFLINYSLWGWTVMIFINTDYLKGANPICRTWIFTEIIAIIVEFPYVIFVGYQKWQIQNPKVKSEIELKEVTPSFSIQGAESLTTDTIVQKSKKKEELIEILNESKKTLEYEEDFFAMTVLCHLKENTAKYGIHPQKQAQMFYSCLIINAIVNSLLFCMLIEMLTDKDKFQPNIAHSFAVFFVKFPCAMALHFVLYPEVANGMSLMKFANNQPHLFVDYGSEISWILGFSQMFSALFCEGICIYMLSFQHTVQHCIIHFVALEVIMEVGNLYFESLKQNYLKKVMHHAPKAEISGSTIKFMKRSCFHKVARILYKFLRMVYVGVIFYFIPFSVMWLQWVVVVPKGGAHH